MRKKFTLFSLALLFLTVYGKAQVPSVIPWNGVVPAILNTAGGTYDNALSYHRYEWSLGELALIQTFAPADSSIILTQGVLQPCTDKVGVSPYTVFFEAGDYKLFPNPTTGRFEIDFFVKTTGQMSLQLINSIGQVIEKRSYHYDGCCTIELFDISGKPAGIYFVVADLVPDTLRADGLLVIRHSGLKLVKMNR